MRRASMAELGKVLDAAVAQPLCVQAWLGYGNVLFFGFGPEVLSLVPADWAPEIVRRRAGGKPMRHPKPPYELQTNFSDWQVIDGSGRVVTSDDRAAAKMAVEELVGREPLGWELLEPGPGLRIGLTGAVLEISPWLENEPTRQTWGFRNPHEFYWWVLEDGRVYQSHKSEPASPDVYPE